MRLRFFRKLFGGLISNNVAIDLGTSSTLIFVENQGIVLNEPTVIAMDSKTNRSIAVGKEAQRMLGRTPPNIKATRPMKDGVIADFQMVEEMLRSFLRMTMKKRLLMRPRAIVCVPSGITAVEMRAVRDSVEHAGAREVYLVAEPVAAAVGVGLPVNDPYGNMVIDIGGGTTEIALIALSGIVTKSSIRVGGDEMDEAILQYIKKKYNLLIGDRSAENIKIQIGSSFPLDEEKEMEIRGNDLVRGIPKTIKVSSSEIRTALQEPVSMIFTAVRHALESTPPELASDIVDNGIVMTGGGALLRGLDAALKEETNLFIKVADNPIECVVKGAGIIVENLTDYEEVLMTGGE
ncbi:rod shape-determining protein [candidate division WOR-3 bacterium]|nr:rod shape-determining protein [candidate division WOR-3 bacterium]